ncbi:MAG TPA: PQQ-binding-like beta-propeller repeat protein [Pirellulales bacterium]|nr:PQQ-binding-like beta-propeller repeat protein [Pirellulales bacterium]
MRKIFPILAVCAILLGHTCAATADDWPQWRGPKRDGVWRESGIVTKLPPGKIAHRWAAPIGAGYCGPTVADGRVFVMDRVDMPKQIERTHAFDAMTGRKLWSHEYDCEYTVQYVAGPRASVSIDEGRAYALGTMGHLHCYDAAGGKVLWAKDLNTEYKIRMPIWGIAASPLVDKDLVIVQIGGEENACLVAFDKVSGKERWRALGDNASYSAPIIIEQAGKRVLVCWTGEHVAGLDPASGKQYWEHPFTPTRMIINIATPIVEKDRLFVSCFYDGSLMLKLLSDRPAVEQIWRRLGPDEKQTDSLHSIISTSYMAGDYVYGVDSYGELRCLDAKTGDRIWESQQAVPRERWATIHMVKHGEDIWMFNDRGELLITRLSPEGFKELSRTKLLDPTTEQLRRKDGVCWSHPAYAYKHVFARNDKELVCADLSAP